MTRRFPVPDRLKAPEHLLTQGQRATDDVLVRVIYRDEREDRIAYASAARAEYVLTRYTKEAFDSDGDAYCYVIRSTEEEGTAA